MNDRFIAGSGRDAAAIPPEVIAISQKIGGLSDLQKKLLSCIVAELDADATAAKLGLPENTRERMYYALLNVVGVPLDLPPPRRREYLKAAVYYAIGEIGHALRCLGGSSSPARTGAAKERGVREISDPQDRKAVETAAAQLVSRGGYLREVAHCIAEGLDIARQLGVSPSSARVYRSNLFKALGLTNAPLSRRMREEFIREAYRIAAAQKAPR